MGSILKKAARGFAQAGVSIADGALAELRQRRLMELQQGFAREEREINRADRKEERQQEVDLRTQERAQDAQYRQQRDQAEDSYRQQTLDKSDHQFDATMDARNEEQEFNRVQGMLAGALSGYSAASQRFADAQALQLKVDREGNPLEDPAAFQERRATMLAEAEAAMEAERERSAAQVQAIRTEFPQYDKWFPKAQPKTEYPVTGAPGLLKKTPAQAGWPDRVKEMDALSRNSAAGMLRQ